MLRRCLLLAALSLGVAAPAAQAITVSSPTVAEDGDLVFQVEGNALQAYTVATAGTATAGTDYTAPNANGALNLAGTGTITVDTLPDSAPEPDETVVLTVTPTLGGTAGTGTGTITDDDPPQLAVFDAKGSEATGYVDIPVGRTLISRPTRVAYTVAAGTAGAADLGATTGEITIPAGAGSGAIRVPVANDTEDEADETFSITISSPDATTIARATGTGTIVNDDTRAIAVSDATAVEGDGAATLVRVPLTLSGPTARTVTAQFATVALTAKAGKDFVARTGTVTFAPGTTQAFIDVPIVSDDDVEKDEQFAVLVGRETNATTARGTAVVKVTDDDATQGDDVAPEVKVTTPKRSGSSAVTLRLTCPKGERTCRSKVTLYTRPDRLSSVKRLRAERRIAGRTVTLKGGASKTVKLTVPRSLRAAAKKARRLKVRAFVVTTDANDNQDTAEKNATLRFR